MLPIKKKMLFSYYFHYLINPFNNIIIIEIKDQITLST